MVEMLNGGGVHVHAIHVDVMIDFVCSSFMLQSTSLRGIRDAQNEKPGQYQTHVSQTIHHRYIDYDKFHS